MDATKRRYDFRMIDRSQIDPPPLPMRQDMDDVALAELAENIVARGIRQPLGVREVDGRFRISWGHRRYVAAGLAEEHVLPCFVIDDDDVTEEQFKNDENRFREEVNPAEEATYYLRLYHEKAGEDVRRVCELTGAKESRVLDRLDLTNGDKRVFEALRRKEITLAVAEELNKVKDDGYRLLFLTDAIAQGMNSKNVRALRQNLDVQQRIAEAHRAGSATDVPPSTESPLGSVDLCPFCASGRDQHEMLYIRVHRSCLAVSERQRDAERGQ